MTSKTTDAVRVATPGDRRAILDIAQATGMFDPDHAADLAAMLDAWFGGEMPDHLWFVHDHAGNGPAAVAYVMPEPMTYGTWNLQFIAVDPAGQAAGTGSDLLAGIEHSLADRKARLLIVETSSLDDYKAARAFYAKRGFEEEARIREFYSTGQDKIVFRKMLTG